MASRIVSDSIAENVNVFLFLLALTHCHGGFNKKVETLEFVLVVTQNTTTWIEEN